MLIGTNKGEIFEISKNSTINRLITGHFEGKLYGLAVHP